MSEQQPDTTYTPQPSIGASLIAEHVVTRYPNRHLYVSNLGWFRWTGTHWTDDDDDGTAAIHQRVTTVAREVAAESIDAHTADERHAMQRAANRVLDRASEPANIVRLLESHPQLRVGPKKLDADPWLLNVANGTLDLRTLQLQAHNPRDYITKITRAAYHPDTTADTWAEFLRTALDDPDLEAALSRCFGGLALPGIVEGRHVFPVLYGPGGSGKSTFSDAIRHTLGDYAITGSDELVIGNGTHPTATMDLRGTRLVLIGETEDGGRINTAVIKRLTGGDRLRARRMYREHVEFDPSHLMCLHTNHLPAVVNGGDSGLWRRLYVVPFDKPPATPDTHLGTRLRLEADGILTWLVHGYADFRDRDGIDWPAAVEQATGAYRSSSDLVGAFLDDTTESCPPPVSTIGTGELFDRWREWLAANAPSEKPGRAQDFRRLLEQRGEAIEDDRHTGTRRGSRVRGRRWISDTWEDEQ